MISSPDRCLLLEEELKKCEHNHDRILSELQLGHERNREEICEEMNRLNIAVQDISVEKEKLRRKLDKILRTARKMKLKYKQKLAQFEESMNLCRAERDKVRSYVLIHAIYVCLSLRF